MSLLKLYDSEKIDKKELKNAFKFIRNYYVQREILHIQHQGYNKEYSKIHKEIDNIMSDDKKLDYIQALCVKFFERMSPAKKIKREEAFREDILSTNFYRMNISFLVDIANNRQNDVRIEYNDVAKNGSVKKNILLNIYCHKLYLTAMSLIKRSGKRALVKIIGRKFI